MLSGKDNLLKGLLLLMEVVMRKTLSTTRLAACVIAVGLLCLGGKCPTGQLPQPRKTGDISITAGYGSAQGAACSPNTNGTVVFKISPLNLTGTEGISLSQSSYGSLPQFATEVSDIGGTFPNYGCQEGKTFQNLKTGTWRVEVSGAAGAGSCTISVSAERESKVKIWQGVCLGP